MSHEDPSAHNQIPGYPEGLPQPGFFNVAALSDTQVVCLGLMLRRGMRYAGSEVNEAAGLFESYGADLAHLAMTEPERGRPLLMRLAQSDIREERELAFWSAVPLCVQDYDFASEMFLTAQDKVKAVNGDYGDVVDPYLAMCDLLPPHLEADLDQRHYERWPDGE